MAALTPVSAADEGVGAAGGGGAEAVTACGEDWRATPGLGVQTTPSFATGETRVVAELDFLPTEEARANYDVGPDGRVLIVRSTSKESYLGHIEIVQPWR